MSAALKRSHVVAEPSRLEQARAAFTDLERWIVSPKALKQSFDDVEREQEKRGREVQRLLLQAHVEQRGAGDVGPAIEVVAQEDGRKRVRRHGQKRHHMRRILSIFGAIVVERLAYHAAQAKSIHPLDEQCALADRAFSYEVQRRLLIGAIQGPFDEALERVHESTGLVVSKRSAEQILREAACNVDTFYESRSRALPPPSKTSQILVAALDSKGVPMVKPETALRVVRLAKGHSANKKRMATVAAVFTQAPRIRTPEEVVESLFRQGPRLKREDGAPPRSAGPEHKRVWASLAKSKDDVIAEAVYEVRRRDRGRKKKTLAVVVDGERGLTTRAAKSFPGAVQILDLLHVTEKLWKCAYTIHPEGSPEAADWVKERTLLVLRGKVSQVIKGIRCSATKRGHRGNQRALIDAVAFYLRRNRERMRYDEYLRQGLPIASGSVEGACKHVIKDRMERSGMRWTIEGAEALLKMRALYLSGDFDDYWTFHMEQERARLYPEKRWRRVTGK